MSVVQGTNDPLYVRSQYENELGLAARKASYSDVSGPDAREVAFRAIAEVDHSRILEVGCGEGELAERMRMELGVEIIAVDQSERMVEITRARGVDARVADVQQLPFADGSFDAIVAAWMLYHVPDLTRGVEELARVLRPGGRLVAVTNAADHLKELFALGGIDRWELPFGAENGAALLGQSFDTVERRDARGTVVFADIDAVRSYFNSSARLSGFVNQLPPSLAGPLVVRRCPVVFVATKSAAV
jgi:SAM-dependent methyltransferase